jgi:sulfur relay (sulfurtransferase) DsrC/TusE family protein
MIIQIEYFDNIMKKLLINRDMVSRRVEMTREECMEKEMTPAQKEVFIVVDEWWKKFGFGPSIRDICTVRKKNGMGNTKEIIDRLVRLGVLKRLKGTGRSVRPVYLNFRSLE